MPTLSLKRPRRSRGGSWVLSLLCLFLPQAEDRATQGCDPSVAWGPRADGPALRRRVGLFFIIDLFSSFISLWPNCDKPNLAAIHVAV